MNLKYAIPLLVMVTLSVGYLAGSSVVKGQLDESEQKIKAMDGKIEQLESTIAKNEQEIKFSQDKIGHHEETIDIYEKDTEEAKDIINQLEIHIKDIEEKKDMLKKDISALIKQEKQIYYEEYGKVLVDSTSNFNLYSPRKNEMLDLNEGFSFRGEIHEHAIGNIEVEVIENGKVLYRLLIDENMFDDGVDFEWTSFSLRIHLDREPKNREAIFRIIDHKSNEEIEIPISFVG